MNRSKLITSLVVCAVALLTVLFSCQAKAAPPVSVQQCMNDAVVKGFVRSGIYGGVLYGGATAVGLAFAPAGTITAGVFVAAVGVNTFVGGTLGVGSSAMTRLSDGSYFKDSIDPVAAACVVKTAKDGLQSLAESAAAQVKKSTVKAAGVVKNAWNSPMPS